jgi:hypothetical protein
MPMPPRSLPRREQVRGACPWWREVALAKPGFCLFVATHRVNRPKALASIDAVLARIPEGTPSDEEAARLFRGVGYSFGAGLDETAGYARGPSALAAAPTERRRATIRMSWRPLRRACGARGGLRGLDAVIDGWLANESSRGGI